MVTLRLNSASGQRRCTVAALMEMVYKVFVKTSTRRRRQSPAAKMQQAELRALTAGRASIGTSTKAYMQMASMKIVCHTARVREVTKVWGKSPQAHIVTSPRVMLTENSSGVKLPPRISEPRTPHKHTPAIQPAFDVTRAVATLHEARRSTSCWRSWALTSSPSHSMQLETWQLGTNKRQEHIGQRTRSLGAIRKTVASSIIAMATPRGVERSASPMAAKQWPHKGRPHAFHLSRPRGRGAERALGKRPPRQAP
mmetsp:Transcript_99057/g.284628  ORF Transcript_99057/g.284628 Transcript_99057/m.284628 type:complete len:254 (+) Transcript_99057:556-1317(+)